MKNETATEFQLKKGQKQKSIKGERQKRLPCNNNKSTTKVKEVRTLKPPCSCKRMCFEKVTEVDRLIIFDEFWKNCCSVEEKRRYVATRIIKVKKERRRVRKCGTGADRRTWTLRYNLQINEEDIRVCQTMFLNTLAINIGFVKSTFNKMKADGLFQPDMRGRHTRVKKRTEAMGKLL